MSARGGDGDGDGRLLRGLDIVLAWELVMVNGF